jgi:four helix bundle protein
MTAENEQNKFNFNEGNAMAYKFEKLEVWQMALDYSDMLYALIDKLPYTENDNLKDQLRRAATSIGLNIAEGSTSSSDAEQARYIGHAIRSLIETVACQHYIKRRKYLQDLTLLRDTYQFSEKLFIKLQALRNTLTSNVAREESAEYILNSKTPFDQD